MRKKPWCVLLTGWMSDVRQRQLYLRQQAHERRDPVHKSLWRALTTSCREQILTVVSVDGVPTDRGAVAYLDRSNVVVQPHFAGSGHEVLIALLELETRVNEHTPVLFVPTDHVVQNEAVMSRSLRSMNDWIEQDPSLIYLLGAVPEGPHNQLGYIVPWYDALDIPAGVYTFIEGPDTHQARQLISAGALWNTFIFGGTVPALLKLYAAEHGATVSALREARARGELADAYGKLGWLDFSRHILSTNPDTLCVLRLPRCGWWPLKGPAPREVQADQGADATPGALS